MFKWYLDVKRLRTAAVWCLSIQLFSERCTKIYLFLLTIRIKSLTYFAPLIQCNIIPLTYFTNFYLIIGEVVFFKNQNLISIYNFEFFSDKNVFF